MKANEFFKKVGIDAARSYVAAYEDALTDELKRLVESHELVESYGGLDELKEFLSTLSMKPNDYLKQAIADVESCQ